MLLVQFLFMLTAFLCISGSRLLREKAEAAETNRRDMINLAELRLAGLVSSLGNLR